MMEELILQLPILIGDIGHYKESVEIIKNSEIEYEFRTTVIK
jgi:hypothetical protein